HVHGERGADGARVVRLVGAGGGRKVRPEGPAEVRGGDDSLLPRGAEAELLLQVARLQSVPEGRPDRPLRHVMRPALLLPALPALAALALVVAECVAGCD